MSLANRIEPNALLAVLTHSPQSSADLSAATGASLATIKRKLDQLVRSGKLLRHGRARATRYTLAPAPTPPQAWRVEEPLPAASATGSPPWSSAGLVLRTALTRPLLARKPVTYQRAFVDDYIPNHTCLLGEPHARALAAAGRLPGQQPAGTYARKVLEQLLIDLSWSSSRLEGNRYSLLATAELFKSGSAEGGDADAVMLLNHKRAIEFMVDAAPVYGLTAPVVRNLHALLMQDLLEDANALGAIRNMVVNIHGSTYLPAQAPALLAEMFTQIIDKACLIKNPVEAAFFVWINFAYLQPFADGNKRTSRLAANVPLMLYNCAPLSFLDVDQHDYALAMMGVYECLDVALARDLFVWTYQRSIDKYAVVLAAAGLPHPLRLRYREAMIAAMGQVVRERQRLAGVVAQLAAARTIAAADQAWFDAAMQEELERLEVHNCARFRLEMRAVEEWIAAGRPQ